MPKGPAVPVQGIWLCREGDYAVVLVEYPDGRQFEAIREHVDGQFSHFIHDHGLAALPERTDKERA